ncbi:MAG: elongation factor G [Planctomycetes bacterium]|nr:elongation factor G [Planctomycetota bacterium]MBI3836004.1 elongation factor G [Planctomycetota bacterium]
MTIDLKTVRNIGIAAHIDAGKTTTTERILFYAGRTHRMGEVDEGTTTTDFDEQEQKRGITIYSAAVTLQWRGHTINLIDTPGHVDFTAEVERSLRVLDGMVAVFDAREGVEAQSETVWRQADKYHVPRICFINKMDRIGADFEHSVNSIRERLSIPPAIIQFPIGASDDLRGVIDVIGEKALFFHEEEQGARFDEAPIPAELADAAAEARHHLVELAAEHSDALMDKYLHNQPVSADEIRKALRVATLKRALTPILCGSSLKHVGVQPLLDAVCDFLPSPLDVPPIEAHDAVNPSKIHKLTCDPKGPLAILVFKIVAEKPVDLFYLRIYSGTLKANSRLVNTATKGKENISRIYRMFAKKRDQIDEATAGDIVAVIGPRDSLTGHTLCDSKCNVILEAIQFPETVISMSIEPRSSKDRDKLMEALKALGRQDPTLSVTSNEETGQTLISGMGELHLEVVVQKLRSEMNVDVLVGKPRVSYRETIAASADAQGEFNRQIGGRNHFAMVRLRIEPKRHEEGKPAFEVVNIAPPDSVFPQYVQAARTGIIDASHSGALGGYPVIDWKATILGGNQSDLESSEVAFENAGRVAFYEAMKAAGPTLLEPIMEVEVVTVDDYFGTIMSDLNSRRGVVKNTDIRGQNRVIAASVPLAQMFGYVTKLRSLSQGRATASMEPSHYAAVPAAEAKILVG